MLLFQFMYSFKNFIFISILFNLKYNYTSGRRPSIYDVDNFSQFFDPPSPVDSRGILATPFPTHTQTVHVMYGWPLDIPTPFYENSVKDKW